MALENKLELHMPFSGPSDFYSSK